MSRDFDRLNIDRLPLRDVVAHGGQGTIRFCRLLERDAPGSSLHFIDVAELPPQASIGEHTHHAHEEEFYLVVAGEGTMTKDGEVFPVRAGDVIRNRPGGRHGLVNTGAAPLKLFVFEIAASGAP